ncbi:putative alcohol dehydrogenase [Dinoroseobacter shibae DFL 12 = DSM 16493]|uniref:Putative alcohol dehydrogenase n=1 Tax=Dinoroseobacter shibae (strain DSM 16493 / NCIMB 14021 / DFL 12) TaxID=398580 RepID=A8LJ14_DINSH|nr:NADPH:quinone oxidoreductase family protein [Dinoroseobacter shibae]ABV94509.1 putative alcohol dehydrogenase [Dinoroseobacter shibae DFL 12 = DSM 16493]URF45936.1 NADPH:quinone oxidoreductase family protein [Dinoroseobacter shibae]URF50242.1 NADPH:quinone oxidoreductase family protein [Dinoroseobacter shibae]
MRAFRTHAHDAPPALEDIPVPDPGPGELRLRIAACGLNFADLLMARGQYQEQPPLPLTLGMEVAGTVDALGPDTTGPAPGTRVAVFGGQGGLAKYGVFPAARCVPLPDGMPETEAAGFQIAYGTSHLALSHTARLQPGETLLVLGAAGGVGLTAVEIGKLMGATVIASARGPAKLDQARKAGADHLVDSDTDDLREAVKSLGGADVVYDPVGGAAFTEALRACKPEARMLLIGFASGDLPEIKPNHLLVKNVSVQGFYWGGFLNFNPTALTDSLAQLFDWYAQGRIKPHVSHVLPLEKAADGLDLLRSRRSTGKVVITP